jgi:hypothetical protein
VRVTNPSGDSIRHSPSVRTDSCAASTMSGE